MKGSYSPLKWSCAFLLLLSLAAAPAQIPPELREKGVLYFEDNLPEKVVATIHAPTNVYMDHFYDNVLATLYADQKIELVGMIPEGFLIRTSYRNNTLNGWIKPEDLPTGVDPSLFETAKKNQAHHEEMAAAIAKKLVLQGMTQDEVLQSIGKPQQTLTHTDANSSALSWVYITYREETRTQYVPDAFGRLFAQTYIVKVRTGQKVIDFTDGVVSAITEQRANPNSSGVISD